MELRICESPEPSHIHVPRPSRVAGHQAQLPAATADDLCLMFARIGETCPTANMD